MEKMSATLFEGLPEESLRDAASVVPYASVHFLRGEGDMEQRRFGTSASAVPYKQIRIPFFGGAVV